MNEQYGFWTVDGSTNFGTMPGGVFEGINEPLPIKLQVGNASWGAIHIDKKHGHWLVKNKQTAAGMLYRKLSDGGSVYSTEEADKSKVNLALMPSALLILRYIPKQKFLTVVSIYEKRGGLDGGFLGRYVGSGVYGCGPVPVPVFLGPAGPMVVSSVATTICNGSRLKTGVLAFDAVFSSN